MLGKTNFHDIDFARDFMILWNYTLVLLFILLITDEFYKPWHLE